MSSTTSGLVRTRFSLQPSSAAPPKSVAVRFPCCNIVPIAPSSTRILCASSSRKALADSFRLRIRWKVLLLRRDEMVQVPKKSSVRSEEHTSELQSRLHLVCRLLLEKKKKTTTIIIITQPKSSTETGYRV